MRLTLTTLLTLAALASCAAAQKPESCVALSAAQKEALVDYVRAKYELPQSAALHLGGDAIAAGTCYHQLTFEGESTLKKWQLKLYLSPDARYLTSDLFDTTLDPVQEERAKAAALMAGLSQNKGSSLGPDNAPVTIVEFSDFQCPYCRRFDSILQGVLPPHAGDVRVVFHHLPLSMHPWARTAAEGAACAQLQNSKAFWAMQSRIFSEQPNITLENVKAKIVQISRDIAGLDPAAFQTCIDDEMSLGLVFRDIDLASSNSVNGTPTIFINGHRVEGVRDAAQLEELISQAKKDLSDKAEAPAAIRASTR